MVNRRGYLGAAQRGAARALAGTIGKKPPGPSAGAVDSYSAKTTRAGREQRGYDGRKKLRGRKRHPLVDTEGLMVEVRVHSAKVPDQHGLKRLWSPCRIASHTSNISGWMPDTMEGARSGPKKRWV
jgi:hypothetical protein